MPLPHGATFAGFRVVRLLGAGGMGEVYLAQHPRLPRRDALKVLAESITVDREFRERFNREADLAAGLFHSHIVGVHDRGEWDGRLWIAMDYVEGTDAARLMRSRYPAGMNRGEAAAIVTAVASALDYAHQRGLLHRDVKPGNILLTEPDGDHERRILLSDFGIARSIDDAQGLTATNMTLGTVAYAAPEQLMGLELEGRTDQYALAATAFELLTGAPPYAHTNPVAVISRHLEGEPPQISKQRPDLADLDEVFKRALARTPADRYERCRDFAKALSGQPDAATASAEANPTVAAEATPSAKSPPQAAARAGTVLGSRPRTVVISVATAVTLLIAALLVAHLRSTESHPSANTATTPVPLASTSVAGSSPASPVDPNTAPPPPPPATQVLTAVAVDTAGNAINGYQEAPPIPGDTLNGCITGAPPESGIYNCSPEAADADICWTAGAAAMMCLVDDDPWKKLVRRYPLDPGSSLSVYPAEGPRAPFALLLDDGTRCRINSRGKTFPTRADGYYPSYDCGGAGSVLALPSVPNDIDRTQPAWTVKIGQSGGEECGDQYSAPCMHFPPPETHTLKTAWLPGI